jgi:hypothetical protein
VASCLLEREALAQGAELEYRAPAGCPSAAEFSARVAQTLQRPLDDFERIGRFRVAIAPAAQGYRLTVSSEVRGERGTRVLSGRDCNSVADAGALSIAMALSSAVEPQAGAQPAGEPSDGVVPKAPARSAERAPPAPAVTESPEPSRDTLAFHLLGDYGALPRVTPGIRLSVGRAGGRWSGRLGVEVLLPATRWVDGDAGAVGGRFWLGAARVEGCLRTAGDARASLDGCLVFEAGALTGSGVGVDVSKQDTLTWLSPGARVVGTLPLSTRRAQAVLGVEGLVPLLNKRFTVERGKTELFHPAAVVGRVDMGVAWQF